MSSSSIAAQALYNEATGVPGVTHRMLNPGLSLKVAQVTASSEPTVFCVDHIRRAAVPLDVAPAFFGQSHSMQISAAIAEVRKSTMS